MGDEYKYGGNYSLPSPRRNPVRYGQHFNHTPVFSDIPSDDEAKTLAGERNPNVLRCLIYRDFVIKKWKPYNLWRVFCGADLSATPEALRGDYTDENVIRRAIDQYLENKNEATSD